MRKIPKYLTTPSVGWVATVGMKRAIEVLRCEASLLTQTGCVLEAHALRTVAKALAKSITKQDAVSEAETLGWDTTEQWHGPTGGRT